MWKSCGALPRGRQGEVAHDLQLETRHVSTLFSTGANSAGLVRRKKFVDNNNHEVQTFDARSDVEFIGPPPWQKQKANIQTLVAGITGCGAFPQPTHQFRALPCPSNETDDLADNRVSKPLCQILGVLRSTELAWMLGRMHLAWLEIHLSSGQSRIPLPWTSILRIIRTRRLQYCALTRTHTGSGWGQCTADAYHIIAFLMNSCRPIS